MTDTQNRVLSLVEVLALPEGARVWVEHPIDGWGWNGAPDDGVHILAIDQYGKKLVGSDYKHWPLGRTWYDGTRFRVWSLPQPPTQEEMEKWPWTEVQHGS